MHLLALCHTVEVAGLRYPFFDGPDISGVAQCHPVIAVTSIIESRISDSEFFWGDASRSLGQIIASFFFRRIVVVVTSFIRESIVVAIVFADAFLDAAVVVFFLVEDVERGLPVAMSLH